MTENEDKTLNGQRQTEEKKARKAQEQVAKEMKEANQSFWLIVFGIVVISAALALIERSRVLTAIIGIVALLALVFYKLEGHKWSGHYQK